jgi:hypothetical protein
MERPTSAHRSIGAGVALIVLMLAVLAASASAPSVPLLGHSRRWAAVAVVFLAMQALTLAAGRRDAGTRVLGAAGLLVLALAALALIEPSQAALTALVVAGAGLVLAATVRAAAGGPHPVT